MQPQARFSMNSSHQQDQVLVELPRKVDLAIGQLLALGVKATAVLVDKHSLAAAHDWCDCVVG